MNYYTFVLTKPHVILKSLKNICAERIYCNGSPDRIDMVQMSRRKTTVKIANIYRVCPIHWMVDIFVEPAAPNGSQQYIIQLIKASVTAIRVIWLRFMFELHGACWLLTPQLICISFEEQFILLGRGHVRCLSTPLVCQDPHSTLGLVKPSYFITAHQCYEN